MKRFLAAAALLLTIWFTYLPVLAQNLNIPTSKMAIGRNPVRYTSANAFSEGRGVWIGWETAVESQNLGFYVYRISGEQKELVSPSLIPGAYMQAAEEKVTAGSYSAFDRFGDADSVYVIESQNVSGKRHLSNLIKTQTVRDLAAVAGVSAADLELQASSARSDIADNQSILPEDLAAEVESQRAAADPAVQRWVAAQPGVKIRVKSTGLYRVSRADLQASNFDVNAPSEKWQLYVNGVEQAIIVGAGGSYIEFYGKEIDTLESETQVYFLVVGAQNGRRIASTIRRRLNAAVTSPSYSQVFSMKERRFYTQNILNGEEENIYGISFNKTFDATFNFNLSGVDFTSANASFNIKIQGLSLVNHSVKITLNGAELGTVSGANYDSMVGQFNLPTSGLREGANTINLVSLNNDGDISAFNSLNVVFARRYQAEQNRLSFFVPNYQTVYAEGFTTPDVRVFDTTNSDAPVLISNLSVDQNGGTYRVLLPANRGRVLHAVETAGLLQPTSIVENVPSTLSTAGNNGDLIIISHKDFLTQSESWAAYRRTQGFVVKVVDIEDVFDEFNYGVSKSDSIRSFLNYAKNSWQNAPEYVLIIGDATSDPKNYFGANANFVPTKLVDTVYSETSSDETLADFNDDGLAEIAIGRIPARTGAVVTLILNKTISFEQTTPGIERGIIFASDLADTFGNDFEGLSNRLCEQLPSSALCIKLSRGEPNANALLVSEFNSGRYMVNYSGHGNVSAWASAAFFGNSQASQMTNSTRLTFFTMLTCLNGYFIGSTDSLSDALLKNPNGGAPAVWASSGLTTADVQEVMATRFYNQLGAGNTPRIGDLIKDAKTSINFGRDVRLSWGLLGDPTLKVR